MTFVQKSAQKKLMKLTPYLLSLKYKGGLIRRNFLAHFLSYHLSRVIIEWGEKRLISDWILIIPFFEVSFAQMR